MNYYIVTIKLCKLEFQVFRPILKLFRALVLSTFIFFSSYSMCFQWGMSASISKTTGDLFVRIYYTSLALVPVFHVIQKYFSVLHCCLILVIALVEFKIKLCLLIRSKYQKGN